MSECYGEWSSDEEENKETKVIKQDFKQIFDKLVQQFPEREKELMSIFNELVNHE